MMEDNMQEYTIFHVTAKDGSDLEMAVLDEFEFDHKHYVAGALVKEDSIDESGCYIYELVVGNDDFTVKKIEKEADYLRIAQAYMNMDE